MRRSRSFLTLALASAVACGACGAEVAEPTPSSVVVPTTDPAAPPATTTSTPADPDDASTTTASVADGGVDSSVDPAAGRVGTGGGAGGEGTGGGGSDGGGSTAGYRGVLDVGPDQVWTELPAPLPAAEPGRSPLTGLPFGSATAAVVVKIDNSRAARPQAGLAAADVVIEEEVEGGITRLAAVFHTADSVVGPVRSARSSDLAYLGSVGEAAFAYSGANRIFDALILDQAHLTNVSAARSGGYWRQSGRSAPSNLFTDTAGFRGDGAPPPPWFEFRDGPADGGEAVSGFDVAFGASSVSWAWDGAGWSRSQDGTAHRLADGTTVAAANVVVVEVESVATGLTDSSGAPVPEFVWAGTGTAHVFTDGRWIAGTWHRRRLAEPAVLVGQDGAVIELTRGRTWIEVVPAGRITLR